MTGRVEAAGGVQKTRMFRSQGPGTFIVPLSDASEASLSAAEMFPVQLDVLQAAPVATGTGFSSGRRWARRSSTLLQGDSLLRFLLFQQLLFLLCKAGQVETIVFPMENSVLRGCYQDAAQSEANNFWLSKKNKTLAV